MHLRLIIIALAVSCFVTAAAPVYTGSDALDKELLALEKKAEYDSSLFRSYFQKTGGYQAEEVQLLLAEFGSPAALVLAQQAADLKKISIQEVKEAFEIRQRYWQGTFNDLKIDSTLPLQSGVKKFSFAMTGISIYWVLPFLLLLFLIAAAPLAAAKWWSKNFLRISLFVFTLPMLTVFLFFMGRHLRAVAFEKILEYLSFILLLSSLFVISGAVVIKGRFRGTPLVNSLFLIFGALCASFIGTTGAAMLLIRPLLRANEHRKHRAHVVVFFIFLVANIGGLLTPLGDPPLFLGFLQGVPFTWTLTLTPQWLEASLAVLLIFYVMDMIIYHREKPLRPAGDLRLGIDGKIHLLLLAGVIAVIALQGAAVRSFKHWPHFGIQEVLLIGLIYLSFKLAPMKGALRKANDFKLHPIKEVGVLFAGLFACMVPALYILEQKAGTLGLSTPFHFFWVTGALSSVLDNAPTYLALFSVEKGLAAAAGSLDLIPHILLPGGEAVRESVLTAVSCGAVFMGAMTYIGNGPNFMVKFIAEDEKVQMPGFFGYMLYSIPVLLPVFYFISLRHF